MRTLLIACFMCMACQAVETNVSSGRDPVTRDSVETNSLAGDDLRDAGASDAGTEADAAVEYKSATLHPAGFRCAADTVCRQHVAK